LSDVLIDDVWEDGVWGHGAIFDHRRHLWGLECLVAATGMVMKNWSFGGGKR
jgi:hypothetical protein